MTRMSGACGLWFLRAMAAKNWASEGYTHLSPDSLRGIVDVSRAVESEEVGPVGAGVAACEEAWV